MLWVCFPLELFRSNTLHIGSICSYNMVCCLFGYLKICHLKIWRILKILVQVIMGQCGRIYFFPIYYYGSSEQDGLYFQNFDEFYLVGSCMLVQVFFFFSSGNLILDGIFACIIMAVYNFEKGLIMFSFSNWKSVFFSSNYNFFPLNLRNDFLVSSNDFFVVLMHNW